jgi:gluconokinase
MDIAIGLDLGTTTCKAVALADDGRVLATASAESVMHVPEAGRAEQDPDELWRCAAAALRQLMERAPPASIQALALSGAMHSLFPVAADNTPLARALTWADQRAAPQARALRARTDAHALYLRTGCPLHAIYYPAQLRWWVEQSPFAHTHFAALKDFVLFQLTSEWAMDFGLASTTGLLDIRRLLWDDGALALAGVRAEQLSTLVSPTAQVGRVTPAAARFTHLPEGLPVMAGGSDGGLANLGAGAQTAGQVVVTVGTSGAVRELVSAPQLDEEERTWCYVLTEGGWFAGGAINNGGLAVQWARDRFYPDLPPDSGYAQMLADAAQIAPGADGLLCLPYLTGERSPHWNADARAVLHGLTLGHSRAHMARAVLEGVAFCLADVWEALGAQADEARLTGGITRSPVWAQIVADVLDVPLVPIEAADASAIGAALLGFNALGQAVRVAVDSAPLIAPDPARHAVYAERHRAFQTLYRQNFA